MNLLYNISLAINFLRKDISLMRNRVIKCRTQYAPS